MSKESCSAFGNPELSIHGEWVSMRDNDSLRGYPLYDSSELQSAVMESAYLTDNDNVPVLDDDGDHVYKPLEDQGYIYLRIKVVTSKKAKPKDTSVSELLASGKKKGKSAFGHKVKCT